MGSCTHQLAGLNYDSRTREVRTAAHRRPCPLSKQSGELFVHFLDAEDHTLTRDEIRFFLWGHQYVSEDTVNHAVCRLRKALDTIKDNDQVMIETIPAMGYRLHGCEEKSHLAVETTAVQHRIARHWIVLISLLSLF